MPNVIDNFSGQYRFLSNFYLSPFEYRGIVYPTVEHFFQAQKTVIIYERQLIACMATPGQAKRAGRECTLRSDWEILKNKVMEYGVHRKFEDKGLAQLLLATGDAVLIEGNTWHDNYWGQCSCERCRNIIGKNMLGHTLTMERTKLQQGGN